MQFKTKYVLVETLKYEKYLLEYHLLADPMTAQMDRNQKYIMEK